MILFHTNSGKTEFSPDEDAHVIADCIKVIHCAVETFHNSTTSQLNAFFAYHNQYVLRELPSSPVPASCCNALLESCRKFVVSAFAFSFTMQVSLIKETQMLYGWLYIAK